MFFDTFIRELPPHFVVISDSEMNYIRLNNAREDLRNLKDLEARYEATLKILQDRIKEKLSIITQLEPPNETKEIHEASTESGTSDLP